MKAIDPPQHSRAGSRSAPHASGRSFGWLLTLGACASIACGVEPIPSIEDAPPFVVSAAPSAGGDVAVLGEPLSVPLDSTVRIRNTTASTFIDIAAANNGSFVGRVAAMPGDRLTVVTLDGSTENSVASATVRSAEAPDALPLPGTNGAIDVSSPVKLTVAITGAASSVAPNARILVGNTVVGVAIDASAEADGSFFVTIQADGGETLSLVTADGERTSGETTLTVPSSDPGDTTSEEDTSTPDATSDPDIDLGDDSSGTDDGEDDLEGEDDDKDGDGDDDKGGDGDDDKGGDGDDHGGDNDTSDDDPDDEKS